MFSTFKKTSPAPRPLTDEEFACCDLHPAVLELAQLKQSLRAANAQ